MQPKMTQEQAERAYKLLVSLWCEQNGLELVSVTIRPRTSDELLTSD